MQNLLEFIISFCSTADFFYMCLSFAFAVCMIFLGEFFYFFCKWSQENTRKFIHIAVCHWWPIASYTVNSIEYAIIPPILFIILNTLSYHLQLVKSMERQKDKADMGTIYYALVLFILVIMTWHSKELRYAAMIGILVLGYGDGLAAVIGKNFPYGKFTVFGKNKTISGSLTMLVVSWVILSVFLQFPFSFSFLVMTFYLAVMISLLEVFTPWGLDNITTTFFTFSIYWFDLAEVDLVLISLIFLATTIAVLAYIKKSLTRNAMLGAIIIGIIIALTSGIIGILSLLLFFISSTLCGRYKKKLKESAERKFAKTGTRDLIQVLANGSIGAFFSCLYYFTTDANYLYAMIVSFATANADTWATELGTLSRENPISLKNFKKVSRGTSGAISFFGLFCSLIGSLFIAVSIFTVSYFFTHITITIHSLLLISLLGFSGAFIDSLLGAYLQCNYQNSQGQITEKKYEDNQNNTHISGISWFNNDIVNITSIFIASLAALFI